MISEITVQDIHREVRSGSDLSTLAPIMRRVVKRTEVDNFDHDSLMRVIRSDIVLTTRLLRAANSDDGGSSQTLDEAAAKVGSQTLRSISLSTDFLNDNNEVGSHYTVYRALQQVWERTLYLAAGSRMFAIELGKPNYDDYHTIGILLHIGIHFLLNRFTDRYLPVLEHWMIHGGDLVQYEKDAIGVDHTIVGHHLARTWQLGKDVEDFIRFQYTTDSISANRVDPKILALANLAAGVFFESRNAQGFNSVTEFAADNFNLSAKDIALLMQRIALEADRVATEMISGSSTVNTIELLHSINQELGRATLSYDQLVRELKSAMNKTESLARKLEEANKKLRKAVNIDPLTRIYNRRFFDEFLVWNFDRSSRYETTLGCMMIDIDHFKRVNDENDHLTGDRILHGVSQTLKSHLRSTDLIARYGGEEFVVMLPETSMDAVRTTASKLLEAVSQRPFSTENGEIGITVSIGYTAYSRKTFPEVKNAVDLIRLADKNMYQAKKNGRNQIWPPLEKKN